MRLKFKFDTLRNILDVLRHTKYFKNVKNITLVTCLNFFFFLKKCMLNYFNVIYMLNDERVRAGKKIGLQKHSHITFVNE